MLKPLRTFARIAVHDRRPLGMPRSTVDAHLHAAERWLCRAHDASSDGGVSYGYTARGGWGPSYPETSGYIASTFFRLGRLRDPSYGERARRIVAWLLSVQNRDGSIGNPRYGPEGIVFDTGQVLFGFVSGYEATGDLDLLQGARRAAAWLVDIADADLRWTRNEHLGTPHVYNTRTAWALLRLDEIEHDEDRVAVARSNLDWAVEAQQDSGYFEHCAFRRGEQPYTHTIAYTARGLLESGLLLGDARYGDAAVRCADATLGLLRDDGFLASMIDLQGRAASTSCCLTGNCQFAIVWLRLQGAWSRPAYAKAAERALGFVMATQDLTTDDADIHGGIKGSHPVWGRYAPLSFPNWATKFFVDAMHLRQEFSA